jgi:hypothetical protein
MQFTFALLHPPARGYIMALFPIVLPCLACSWVSHGQVRHRYRALRTLSRMLREQHLRASHCWANTMDSHGGLVQQDVWRAFGPSFQVSSALRVSTCPWIHRIDCAILVVAHRQLRASHPSQLLQCSDAFACPCQFAVTVPRWFCFDELQDCCVGRG